MRHVRLIGNPPDVKILGEILPDENVTPMTDKGPIPAPPKPQHFKPLAPPPRPPVKGEYSSNSAIVINLSYFLTEKDHLVLDLNEVM